MPGSSRMPISLRSSGSAKGGSSSALSLGLVNLDLYVPNGFPACLSPASPDGRIANSQRPGR